MYDGCSLCGAPCASLLCFSALAAEWADQGSKRWKKGAAAVIYTVIGGFCTLSVLIYVIL